MPQRKIQRMISAKTASRNPNLRSPILPLQEWHKIIHNVALILHMPPNPRSRMHALVVQALTVHAVHAEYLQLSRVNLRRQRPDHPRIFIFEKTPLRTGEDKQRLSRMPEDQCLHVPLQLMAVILVKFAIHFEGGLYPNRQFPGSK